MPPKRSAANVIDVLTACPCCESTLIQIEDRRTLVRSTLLERYCPECGNCDVLAVTSAVADGLCEQAGETATALDELADRLAAASELVLRDADQPALSDD